MRRLLVLLAMMLLTASCAMAQSEMPKLTLRDIADQSKIVYELEGGATYESGPEDSSTYLNAWYDDFGYLSGYIFRYDCGCEVWYDGSGREDVPNSNNQCGHTAPVKHTSKLNLMDEEITKALKELTGKAYTLEYLKTPAEMGSITGEADKKTFVLEDKGYEAVAMWGRNNKRFPAEAVYEGGNKCWKAVLNKATQMKDVKLVVKKDGKLTYLESDGTVFGVELGDYCEYDTESDTFWVHAGALYNAFASYDGAGKMYEYGYDKSDASSYGRVHYDMENTLTYAVFADELGREWFYTTENGWLLYDEARGEDVPETPDQIALASVLPPIRKQTYQAPVVTDAGEMKETDVPFVLADAQTAKALEKEGLTLSVTAYPPQEQQIRYDLSWVNDEGKKVTGSYGVDVVLAWPYGLDLAWAKEYSFAVEHTLSSGATEVFSTLDGTAAITDAGLKIHVTSFSPFVLKWGTQQEMQQIVNAQVSVPANLPTTGDSSRMMLWVSLLALSLCVFAAGRRVRT